MASSGASHLAYSPGAIRQIAVGARGPREGTFAADAPASAAHPSSFLPADWEPAHAIAGFAGTDSIASKPWVCR
jgi:hypothetical protein